MTEKQKRFCDEYLIDLNGTRAYKAAYPSVKNDKTAGANAARLLGNASVRAYLDERLEQLHNERTADAAEVMEYLTAVLRGESEASVVVVESVGDGCSEARTITKPPDERERLKAAEEQRQQQRVALVDPLHAEALADGHGKSVHRKTDADQEQFKKSHGLSSAHKKIRYVAAPENKTQVRQNHT